MREKIQMAYLILHYNTIEETRTCIRAIRQMPSFPQTQILIVDNASPNGSGKILRDEYASQENITVLLNPENAGFSRGNNLGYTYIRDHWDADFVTVCNNDIVFPDPDYVEKVRNIHELSPFHVLGPDVFNPRLGIHQSPLGESSPSRQEAQRTLRLNALAETFFPVFWPLIGRRDAQRLHHRGDSVPTWNRPQEGIPLMGACLILSREFMVSNGKLFTPETDFYYEEYLLYNRCRRQGMRMIYRPEVRVEHLEGSATVTLDRSEKNRYRRMVHNTRRAVAVYLQDLKDHGE